MILAVVSASAEVQDFATSAGLGAAALAFIDADDLRREAFEAYMAEQAGAPVPAPMREAISCAAELCGLLHKLLRGPE